MSEKDIKEKSNRGGAREGAGRPAGSKNKISKASAQTVAEILYDKTGMIYEELLVEDFLASRLQGDTQLSHKYHNLLASKLMPTLNEVAVEEVGDMVEGKQQAFLAALTALKQSNDENNINKSKDKDNASD